MIRFDDVHKAFGPKVVLDGVTRERVRQLRDRALKRLGEGDVGRALASFAA